MTIFPLGIIAVGASISVSAYTYLASNDIVVAMIGLIGTCISSAGMVVAAYVTIRKVDRVEARINRKDDDGDSR